jgi:thioredoxin reductase (NADPH)
MQYDLIIVGGGVAGCSAAVTACQRNLNTLVLYAGDGDLARAKLVGNYVGLPDLNGLEMLKMMRDHAKGKGAEFKHSLVRRVMPLGEEFSVLAGNDLFTARSVILAMGTARVKMLEGEEALIGQGVSYCATCDGMFYKGGSVLVIAASKDAVEEANYLATLAKVVYCKEKPHDTDGLSEDIELVGGTPLSLRMQDGRIVLMNSMGEIAADGAFIIRPAVVMTQLIPEVQTEMGAMTLSKSLMTSVPGVFAAGDITGHPWQVAKAAGEGNIAVLAAISWLVKSKGSASKPEEAQ